MLREAKVSDAVDVGVADAVTEPVSGVVGVVAGDDVVGAGLLLVPAAGAVDASALAEVGAALADAAERVPAVIDRANAETATLVMRPSEGAGALWAALRRR